ncbi:MAG: hypothetical protein O7F12_14050 [Nitrospirae bacterium]|nr:hypothetical protein [Nitrospirota bacterium]
MARNIYQITGLDDQERGFSRQVEVSEEAGKYLALFRYEKIRVEMAGDETESATIEALIHQLHQQGYTQLQTRLQFQGETYLGTQEFWTEYPDPIREQPESESWWRKMLRSFMGNPPEPPMETVGEDQDPKGHAKS